MSDIGVGLGLGASHLVGSYDRGQREPSAEEHRPRDPDVLPSGRHRSVDRSFSVC